VISLLPPRALRAAPLSSSSEPCAESMSHTLSDRCGPFRSHGLQVPLSAHLSLNVRGRRVAGAVTALVEVSVVSRSTGLFSRSGRGFR
jgi:hypothetical protein